MTVKICPKCKYANKYISKTCVLCGFSFPPLTGPPPDRSQESTRRIRPEQWVGCPHCHSETHVEGCGRNRCGECRRYFEYYGPFKIQCQGCGKDISLTIESKKETTVCPHCGQKYRLDLPSEAEQWARVGGFCC